MASSHLRARRSKRFVKSMARSGERAMLYFREGLALVDRGIWSRISRADVFGARSDEPVVVVLLDDVRCPAGDTADREDGCKEVDIDAKQGVGGGGVEVHVGIELLLLLDEQLDLAGHL